MTASLSYRVFGDAKRLAFEFQVRSATTLGSDGQLRLLSRQEWAQKKQLLLQREIQSETAISAARGPAPLTAAQLADKRRLLLELRRNP